MHSKKIKIVFSILLVLAILVLTFLRENLFLEINSIINNQTYNKAYFYWFNDWFNQLSIVSLLRLKWLLTICFVLMVSSITALVIQINFRKDQLFFIIKLYLVIFVLLLVLSTFLWLSGGWNLGYFVLRKIIGVLQSPLPLFVLYPFMYFSNNKSISNNT